MLKKNKRKKIRFYIISGFLEYLKNLKFVFFFGSVKKDSNFGFRSSTVKDLFNGRRWNKEKKKKITTK